MVVEFMFRYSTELEMTFSNFQRSIAMYRLHRFEVLTFYRIKYNILEYDVSAKNHIPREYVNGGISICFPYQFSGSACTQNCCKRRQLLSIERWAQIAYTSYADSADLCNFNLDFELQHAYN